MIGSITRKCILIGLLSRLLIAIALFDNFPRFDEDFHFEVGAVNDTASLIVNFKEKRHANQLNESLENVQRTFQNKANTLSRLLKIHIDRLRNETDQVIQNFYAASFIISNSNNFCQIELVFLVDASGSVGLKNFQSELNFVKNLLSDFSVEPSVTRVAIVTFGGRRNIRRNVDQISRGSEIDNKCYLLNKQLNNITYTGGGTYTKGALLEAYVSVFLSADQY